MTPTPTNTPETVERLREKPKSDAWKDWTRHPRGCGRCTVREFEQVQLRAMRGLIAILRKRNALAQH